jgi:hypothetical protein
MADLKISQLPAVTMPLAETEVLPLVQSATTKKVTVAQLTTLIKHTMTMDGTNALQFGGAGFTASINYNDDGSLRIKPRAGYPVQLDLANLRFSNAGYGVDFSANTHAAGMTSELLNYYEEGNYTPTVAATTGSITSFTATAYYTRIGRQVTVTSLVTITNAGTGAGTLTVSLPFTANGNIPFSGTGRENALTGNALQCNITAGGTVANVVNASNTTVIATGAQVRSTVTYFV